MAVIWTGEGADRAGGSGLVAGADTGLWFGGLVAGGCTPGWWQWGLGPVNFGVCGRGFNGMVGFGLVTGFIGLVGFGLVTGGLLGWWVLG